MQIRLLRKGLGTVVSLFWATVLALPILQAEPKPVLTVSTANPETLYQIAEKIATLTGMLDDFHAVSVPYKELKGIDRKNPIVFVLHAEGDEFKDPLLFLPITDLTKVEIPGFEMLLPQARRQSDGRYLLSTPAGAFVLTPKKGYLVASSESSEMPIPDDPAKFLKGLETYSLGIRIDTENTSAEAVQMLLAPFQLIAGIQFGEQATQAFEQINQAVEQMCREFRSMTIGLAMDPKNADTTIQVNVVAKSGSETAKAIEFQKNATTVFGGFLGDTNAVMAFSAVGKGLKDNSDQLEIMAHSIDQLIGGLLEQVEENAEEDEDVELAETIAASLKKMLLATSALEKIDYGFSLSNDGTFALGTSLAEGKELEKIGSLILKRLEKLAPDKEQFANTVKKMKTNHATVEGFQLSSFVFPLGEISPEFFADKTFHAYWGLKNDAFVLWSGFDSKSEEQLKSAIAAMKKPIANQGGHGKFSMMQLGNLLKNFQMASVAPETVTDLVKAFIAAGPDANIVLSQATLDQVSAVGTLSISGKIWDAVVKIAAIAQELQGGD